MKVIVSERCVTLRAFSLPCVVSGLQALKTEHVKALGQNGVFLTGITTRTCQLCLKKIKKPFKRYLNTSSTSESSIKINVIYTSGVLLQHNVIYTFGALW